MQLSVSLNCRFVFCKFDPSGYEWGILAIYRVYVVQMSLMYQKRLVCFLPGQVRYQPAVRGLHRGRVRSEEVTLPHRQKKKKKKRVFCIYCTDFSQFNSIILILCLLHVFFCRRFALSSMDMEQRDYDSRTALHVAAAEGNVNVRVNSSIVCIDTMVCCLFPVTDLIFSPRCVETMLMYNLWLSGHAEVVRFLLEACKVNPVPKDR